jgi:hypothetical protein
VAFCYLIGSVGFAMGGFTSCLKAVIDKPRSYLYLEVTPYVVGGGGGGACTMRGLAP